jgi:hypothetical protein
MNDTMHDRPHRPDPIPSLVALGHQFDLVAAAAVAAAAERPQRAPRSWGLVVAPAFAVLVALMVVSIRLTPPADAAVVQAAERTAAQVTGRFVMRTHVATAGGTTDRPIDLTSEGTYDRASGRLRSTVDLSRVFGGAGGSGGTGGSIGGPVDTIKDGPRVYLRADVFTNMLPKHRPWVVLDTTRINPSSGLAVTGELDSTVTDPASFLEALRGIGDDTHAVGEEDIDGAATVHFRGTVSLDRAAGQLSPGERDRLREGFAGLGVVGEHLVLPMDVWVDGQGDVRRVATTLDVASATTAGSAPTAAATASVAISIDYRDLGGPAPIDLPAPDDTSDITDLVNTALDGPLQGLTTPG